LKPLKIHFDNQIFRLQKYGGISKYFVRLTEELKILRQQPKILGGFHMNAYLRDFNSASASGIYMEKYPKRTIRLLREAGNYFNHGYQFVQKPDIIHETYFNNAPSLKSKSSARVVTEYDCLHELFPDFFPISYLKTKEKQAAFERSDVIISISHQTKADMLNFFNLDEKKIKVTHLAADPPIADHLIIMPTPRPRPFLLYVGIRLKHKNFARMVKAFSRSRFLMQEFDLVAFCPQEFSQEEVTLFRELGFRPDQIRWEKGDDDRLAGFFKTAHAFVYPSIYEGFGIPPLEAMSYGCPVVCSNSSSLPEVVGDSALCFNPLDEEEITFQLEKMGLESSLSRDLRSKGYERIKSFSWKKTAEETLSIYRELVR
jgi:glycosyltransferase involved in cell wall biosynthesis